MDVAWERTVALDVLDPQQAPFFERLRLGNGHAFGDIGMPAWVQLDCATLPTAMIGFARRARDLPKALRPIFAPAPARDDDDLFPVAEYCALMTPTPGEVVGFSLYTLEPGLGLRAKAAALYAYDATVQVGMTQHDNSALKTHSRLGPLQIVQVGVAVHSRPHSTLVYRLTVPSSSTLAELALGTRTRVLTDDAADATTTKPLTALLAGDVVVDVTGGMAVVQA